LKKADEHTMASLPTSALVPLDFPSGSYWRAKGIRAVRFAKEPKEPAFSLFDETIRVPARLSRVFEVPVGRFQDGEGVDPYKEHRGFYDQLASEL
jgi:hypothetical protein